jgi:hypothetical protein
MTIVCAFCSLELEGCICAAGPVSKDALRDGRRPPDALERAISKAHPLDARALKARLESETTRADLAEQRADKLVEKNDVLMADRGIVIGVLRARCAKLESAIKAFIDGADETYPASVLALAAALDWLPLEKPK